MMTTYVELARKKTGRFFKVCNLRIWWLDILCKMRMRQAKQFTAMFTVTWPLTCFLSYWLLSKQIVIRMSKRSVLYQQ